MRELTADESSELEALREGTDAEATAAMCKEMADALVANCKDVNGAVKKGFLFHSLAFVMKMALAATSTRQRALARETQDGLSVLRARVEALEEHQKNAPRFEYRGVFERNVSYRPGDGVTHHGSMWIARELAPGVPGESKGWTLAVKKGRDSRHA